MRRGILDVFDCIIQEMSRIRKDINPGMMMYWASSYMLLGFVFLITENASRFFVQVWSSFIQLRQGRKLVYEEFVFESTSTVLCEGSDGPVVVCLVIIKH